MFPIFTHVSQFQGKVIFDALASNERVCANNIKLELFVQKLVLNLRPSVINICSSQGSRLWEFLLKSKKNFYNELFFFFFSKKVFGIFNPPHEKREETVDHDNEILLSFKRVKTQASRVKTVM